MDSAHVLTSPALLYLFADAFIPPANSAFKEPALAPRTGAKVELKQLVLTTYAAAFMDLVERGAIQLAATEFKKFLGKETALVAQPTGDAQMPADTLAARLLAIIGAAAKPEQRRVREVAISLVGGRESSNYPYLVALAPVIHEAAAAGFVILPEKKPGVLKAMFKPYESVTGVTPVTERIDAVRGDAQAALSRLQAFEARLSAQAAMLRKELETGISACLDSGSD